MRGGALDFNSNLQNTSSCRHVSPLKRTSTQRLGGKITVEEDLRILPKRYKRCLDDLHDSLNTIIQILSKVKDKTWRRKLAGICVLTLGMLEFPETSLQDITEGEENYIG